MLNYRIGEIVQVEVGSDGVVRPGIVLSFTPEGQAMVEVLLGGGRGITKVIGASDTVAVGEAEPAQTAASEPAPAATPAPPASDLEAAVAALQAQVASLTEQLATAVQYGESLRQQLATVARDAATEEATPVPPAPPAEPQPPSTRETPATQAPAEGAGA